MVVDAQTLQLAQHIGTMLMIRIIPLYKITYAPNKLCTAMSQHLAVGRTLAHPVFDLVSLEFCNNGEILKCILLDLRPMRLHDGKAYQRHNEDERNEQRNDAGSSCRTCLLQQFLIGDITITG